MSNNNTEELSAGVPPEFQAFFNRLDGRKTVKTDTLEAKTVELKTVDGQTIEIGGALKNNTASIKAKRKGK